MKKMISCFIFASLLFICSAPGGAYGADVPSLDWQWVNPFPTGNTITGIKYNADGGYYVVGEAGTSFYVDKSGAVTEIEADSNLWFSSIWGTGDDIFAAGYQGLVARYDRSKNGWSIFKTGVSNDLNGIWGMDAKNIYAVGDRGTILHYDGSSWTRAKTGMHDLLFGIWGSSSDNLIAVGGRGSVLRFDGKSWKAEEVSRGVHFVGVTGYGADDIYIYGDNGSLFHFNGAGWADQSIVLGKKSTDYGLLLRGLFKDNTGSLYTFSDDGRIYKRVNGSWTISEKINAGTDRILGHAEWNGEQVLFGDGGRQYRIKNGRLLEDKQTTLRQNLHKITGAGNNKTGLVIASDSAVVFMKDGRLKSLKTSKMWDVWYNRGGIFSRKSRGYFLAGTEGKMFRLNTDPDININTKIKADGPEEISTPFNNEIFGIWGDNKKIYGAGSNGLVFIYDMKTFKEYRVGSSSFFSIWGRNRKDIYAVGEKGRIAHFNGKEWATEESHVDVSLFAVGGGDDTVYAVGDNGVILKKSKTGWNRMEIASAAQLFDIQHVNGRGTFFAGSRGTLICSCGNNLVFVPTPTFNDIYGITVNKTGIILTGENGTVIKGAFN